ncbi:UDP-N-acetylmuramoylalanine--D-glutamate ligase [Klenkia marina]|uniref:UDP-N-acetylmuramoylalanine--D-glutamate ligase n=1 Tax=Klenkia marina TaxID=1960309 RepID=A0A1G4YA30_9ACTN|nr:UDP-N-acetylmuramoyl-L-alanine--D-glutamate ligase [Klenkia marina]SCX50209.1 UDP-N-acetylmuramoylalanine--D-glutamate ligase [Klenkia marina]
MTGPLGRVLVCGLGVSGAAAARVLLARGDTVLLADAGNPAARTELEAAGAVWLGAVTDCPDDVDLVVTSPGWRPDSPLLVSAARAGVEVVGEPELAWRLRLPLADGEPAPWYAVTGTNGKTTTVTMLEALLLAGGRRAVAAGNVGRPLVEVVTAVDVDGAPAFDAVAVELSSFQLHWSSSVTPAAAAVLNIADDHVDWHGSAAAYRDAKAKILHGAPVAVADAADPVASALVAGHPHPVTVTLGEPGPGQLGVVDGVLVDRALGGGELLPVDALQVTGPHNVINALAAAALARAAGVSAGDIATGLAGFRGGAHRTVQVAVRDGVAWVDDSKATNPHAAAASLTAYPRVVWIAGGLLKGADVEPLVAAVASRLAGVVLLGRDRQVLADSLARHAPAVPRIVVPSGDDVGVAGVTNGTAEAVMVQVVRAAAELARPGDTVLLAPAAASMDVFTDYAHRGRAFADAVRALP